mmetsp:Transcript_63517/g.161181  ORF Transcript_63517/g.161181 Transcript_63517/m.161181 type:complete len:183 (-) Transcript_63517:111-659(-)
MQWVQGSAVDSMTWNRYATDQETGDPWNQGQGQGLYMGRPGMNGNGPLNHFNGMAAGGLSTSGVAGGFGSRMWAPSNGPPDTSLAGWGNASGVAGPAAGSDDRRMMGGAEDSSRFVLARESSDEDDGPPQPAEATAEERLEAEEIVRKAFKDARERDKLREKAKKCSPADLQAMLNSRLAKC